MNKVAIGEAYTTHNLCYIHVLVHTYTRTQQRTENREQRTENREQRTENREQRTENREQRTENGDLENIN